MLLPLATLLPLLSCLGPSYASEIDSAKRKQELEAKWSWEWSFDGISTFAHMPHVKCLVMPDEAYDIAIVGVPFDTSVSYRPGARFGPRALRAASARQLPSRGYNPRAKINPYASWAKIIDCGDIPATPMDNALALRQITEGYRELGNRSAVHPQLSKPRLITLGGDHSLALPALRALSALYDQPIHVVHLDAHLDTWAADAYDSTWFDASLPIEKQQSAFTHGTMFWLAWKEGLVASPSVHGGLRTRLQDENDNKDDTNQGWVRFSSDEVSAPPDGIGPQGLAQRIMEILGTEVPVYLSVDIDVLDPGLAPGTGTPEPGGWSTRELVQVLRGIEGLNLVGADLVEVSPPFDGKGEQTALAGAQVVYEILTSMVKRGEKEGLSTLKMQERQRGNRDEL